MNTLDQPDAVPSNCHPATTLTTFSQIDVELTALVSQMEVEIAESGTVTQESASNLHAFRRKVEAMLIPGVDER